MLSTTTEACFVQKVETAFELLYVQNERMPERDQEQTHASLADTFIGLEENRCIF
jgi:hypothetical protein